MCMVLNYACEEHKKGKVKSMEFKKFYEIAEYGNVAWKGCFSAKEVAQNAYDYLCDFEASKENGQPTRIIQELAKLLAEDGSEECKDWLYDMARELDLIDMDFWDYAETDADIVSCFLGEPEQPKRNYRSVELKGSDAGRFREYLRDMHLKYEASGAGEYIHFEVLVSEEELEKANEFLSNLD